MKATGRIYSWIMRGIGLLDCAVLCTFRYEASRSQVLLGAMTVVHASANYLAPEKTADFFFFCEFFFCGLSIVEV